jgi:hypothetical protein
MTIQEAARKILEEKENTLTSREISKIALDRGMVTSAARDPVQSLASTIEKNIRDKVYNVPRLCFLRDEKGRRVIGLPEWGSKKITTNPLARPRTVEITSEAVEMIELAREAGIGADETETIAYLITAGFRSCADEIDSGLLQRLSELKKRMEILKQNRV